MVRVADARSIGSTVRDARLAAGLTQQELAQRIGVSLRWVSKFESDASTSHLDKVLAAARAVGLVIDIVGTAPDPKRAAVIERAFGAFDG